MTDDTAAAAAAPADRPPRAGVREVALVAFKLGCTAFGGPAAHVAMLREETVVRRRWTSEDHFLDLLGATNLIPGPNSTEMVIHTGYEQAGWRGLVAGGSLFILPAASLSLGFAWLYDRYGATPNGEWLLAGVEPVVVAVVLHAIWGLGRTGLRDARLAVLAAAVLALYLLGVNELLLLFGAGALVAIIRNVYRLGASRGPGAASLLPWLTLGPITIPALAGTAEPYSAPRLFLLFLKIGATLYGSGYVLLAFLRNDFVARTGWLTERQLLDAVAVGQFTPGPVFSTATFVGYLVGGFWGAVLATLAIFLPAFLLVAVTNPLVPRLRRSPWTAGFLDGVNAAALGLMAAVAWTLGRAAIDDLPSAAIALAAALLLIRTRINSAWLVLAGALVGLALGRAGW